MQSSLPFYLSFYLLLLLLTSCGKTYFYENSAYLPDQIWTYQNIQQHQVTITDISQPYNLLLEVSHNTDFSYQNIYLQLQVTMPDGQKGTTLIPFDLANKAGHWYGDCNADWCTLVAPLQSGVVFQQAGEYQFSMEQYMRVDSLEGIRAMGLKVERRAGE